MNNTITDCESRFLTLLSGSPYPTLITDDLKEMCERLKSQKLISTKVEIVFDRRRNRMTPRMSVRILAKGRKLIGGEK